MATVGSYEAKTHLPSLLKRVAEGEEITITRHGVPIARLVPAGGRSQAEVEAAARNIQAWRDYRKTRGLPSVSSDEILEMIREGRRY